MALEEVDIDYVDVARRTESSDMGTKAMMDLLESTEIANKPFAPPFLKTGQLIIGQTPNILLFLGAQHNLAPQDQAKQLWIHQLQLTIADFVTEAHDSHHPIGGNFYYEDQKPEALRRAEDFKSERMPKFLGYFESVIKQNLDSASTGKSSPGTTRTRSEATAKALKKEGHSTASRSSISKQTKSAAQKRSATSRSKSAKKIARTKGAVGRSAAARKAAKTRAKRNK